MFNDLKIHTDYKDLKDFLVTGEPVKILRYLAKFRAI